MAAALEAIVQAGQHGRIADAELIRVESLGEISEAAALAAFELGRKMRAAGLPCLCHQCRRANVKEVRS